VELGEQVSDSRTRQDGLFALLFVSVSVSVCVSVCRVCSFLLILGFSLFGLFCCCSDGCE
jgi:hypothetical protein